MKASTILHKAIIQWVARKKVSLIIIYSQSLHTVEHEIHACPKYSEFGSFAS